jgi:hypothetical protein
MTHQPPVPEAATSPYPLHPAPIPEERKLAAAAAEEASLAKQRSQAFPVAAIVASGLGAAVALTAFLYRRSRPATAQSGEATRTRGDDKSKRGGADRSRVAAGQPYEVTYFARKHRITAAEARAIIKEAGPDRKAANALADKRKKA